MKIHQILINHSGRLPKEIPPYAQMCVKSITDFYGTEEYHLYSGEEIEDFLPLSFWRHLLSNRQYGALWLPSLYRVFPEVNKPKDIKIFRLIWRSTPPIEVVEKSISNGSY